MHRWRAAGSPAARDRSVDGPRRTEKTPVYLCSKSRPGRVAVAMIAAAVAAAVSGCGAGTQGGASAPSAAGQVKLTLKHPSANRVALTKLIAAYGRVAPNVTINASYAGVDEL